MQTINTNITTGLVVIVLALLGYLLVLSLRRPVLAKLGLRNIPRRPAQSTLIVLGLTLSTIIIVSALSTGDTLTYSLRRQAVGAYGQIDEIIAPPLLSMLMTLSTDSGQPEEALVTVDAADNTFAADSSAAQNRDQINELMKGGLTSVLTILEGGLPGISTARYQELRAAAADEPLIDAVASSILFPTIIRNVSTGQGEPLGFVFAVDGDYDQSFGLTTVAGEPVQMDALQPGVGNIFVQASKLFSIAQNQGQRLLGDNFSLSNVALATAALGSALTANGGAGGPTTAVDLAQLSIPLSTLQAVGIDTTQLEQEGITETVSLAALGVTPDTLQQIGVNTTTLSLDASQIIPSRVQTTTAQLLGALNLNTLGAEIDRVLAEFGLQLRQGDLYLNQLGADKLNAQVGDVLEIFVGPIPIPFRVKAIVAEAGPVGVLMPVVMMRLDEAQKVFFMHDKVNNVLISNQGDELSGLAQTTAVSERLKVLALDPAVVEQLAAILRRPAVRAVLDPAAARIVEQTDEEIDAPPIIANLFKNLANVGAYQGQIKILPALLDQPAISDELRVIFANNEVRSWLTRLPLAAPDGANLKTALAALNQFDVIDPLNKATMVQAASAGGAIFTTIFSLFGIFSILAGVMLIFLIFVMLAAERRSEMGMARAIGVQRSHLVQMFVTEGVIYDLVAALFGVALGLGISYLMVGFLGGIFNNVSSQLGVAGAFFRFSFHVQPSSVLIAYCLGVILTFGVVTVASWRVSHLNIVTAIRALPDDANAKTRSLLNRIWRWSFGPLLALLGAYCWRAPWGDGYTNVLLAVTLLLAGVLILVERLLEPTPRPMGSRPEQVQRLLFTLLGLGLLVIWTVPWDALIGRATSVLDQTGPLFLAAFALRAPMIILGAILAIMFNADALTWAFSHLVGGLSSLTPVLKTAIAYPLSTRFRTGMAMVMFAMIICTVVIMAVVIQATQALITLDAKQSAGFEITVSPTLLSFFDPISDLSARMAQQTDADLSDVAAVGAVAREAVAARPVGADGRWGSAQLDGVDPGYLAQAAQVYHFQARAAGYADDAALWEALRTRNDVAIVTPDLLTAATGPSAESIANNANTSEAAGFEILLPFLLYDVDPASEALPERWIEVRPANGNNPFADTPDGDGVAPHRLQIIGVLDDSSTLAGSQIQTNLAALASLTGQPVTPDHFYVKVEEGAEVHAVARELERAFLSSGLDAAVMAETFAAGRNVTRGILQLFQGFMALGLLVGIAALGVISSRTVVERRQQVGMLRAIGYHAGMVAFSFVLEASFIALTGIFIGAAAGLILGQNIVATFFTGLTPAAQHALPWLQIGLILLLAYGFSLLTTILPAYQAARIYPAEALRYE